MDDQLAWCRAYERIQHECRKKCFSPLSLQIMKNYQIAMIQKRHDCRRLDW